EASPSEFYHSGEARARLGAAERTLRDLPAEAKCAPSGYYAVLALDGDQIGKWLSGEKSPPVERVISPKAVDYFRQNISGLDVEKWLKSPRPLSPSWHLQFSEALANFGLYAARRIVEEVHHGQLIYSGGDDVLAMLPADEAIACARDLRAAFQGRLADMGVECQEHFREDAPEGFLWLANPKRGEPAWPLLVPGPRMTVSVGLVIGHIKEPLQDMIAEAQAAEKRAKNKLGRNALAATLFKRSGETIQWGTQFSHENGKTSAALDLLAFIQSSNRYRKPFDQPDYKPPISGKFPYRVAELLRRYQNYEVRDRLPDYSKPAPLDPEVRQIAEREFEWVIRRQCDKLPDQEKSKLAKLASDCLRELENQKQPLSQFIHLFALEAFIARTGE
ncbi:MAG: type III-B CRISPR-associated protein Cas10/Cmr2, partial [Gemmataceae bacterium]